MAPSPCSFVRSSHFEGVDVRLGANHLEPALGDAKRPWLTILVAPPYRQATLYRNLLNRLLFF